MNILLANKRRSKGVALLSVVMSLAIVGILSGMYLGGGPGAAPGAKPWPQQITDRARSGVCTANRRTAMTELAYVQIDYGTNRLTSDLLQATAKKLPVCPGDGKFYIHNDDIYCAQHTPTATFRAYYGLVPAE